MKLLTVQLLRRINALIDFTVHKSCCSVLGRLGGDHRALLLGVVMMVIKLTRSTCEFYICRRRGRG